MLIYYREDKKMIKNKVLTPVLAGVLGVSVIGSGVGYYLVNKGDKESKSEQTMDSMKISFADVEQNMTTAVDDVNKAVTGQLDFAYDSSLKFTFGAGLTGSAATANSQQQIKPFEIDTKVKQKGQNSQAEISAKYNDSVIATLEAIYARDNKTAYMRVPELSSAYITANEQDIQKAVQDYANKAQSQLTNRSTTIKRNTTQTPKVSTDSDLNKLKAQLPDLSSIDGKKLEEKIKSYAETFKSKLPAKKDGANLTGDIDGNKYDYKTVNYSINGKQAQDALYAVFDKLAGDADVKKIFDDFMAKQRSSSASTKAKSYADFIAELKKESAVPENNQSKVLSLDLYYDGEEISGLAITFDNKTIIKAVVINKNDVNAVDVTVSDGNADKNALVIKGSAKLTDGTVNGVYNVSFKDGGKQIFTAKLTLEKVVAKQDYFSGTIIFNINVNESSKAHTLDVKLSGESSKDKKDLTFNVDADGKNVVTVEFKLNKTEASDIAIPTGKTYKLTELEEYAKTIDIENFKAHINDAIGYNVSGLVDSFGSYTAKSRQAQSKVKTTTPSTTDIVYE